MYALFLSHYNLNLHCDCIFNVSKWLIRTSDYFNPRLKSLCLKPTIISNWLWTLIYQKPLIFTALKSSVLRTYWQYVISMQNVNKNQIVDTFQTTNFLHAIELYKYLFVGNTRLGFLIQLNSNVNTWRPTINFKF